MTDNPVHLFPTPSMPMPSARSASHALLRAVVPMLAVALAACSMTPPPPSAPPAPVVTPAQRLAAVDAAADADATELDVQPLRDPEVDDLRAAASRARAAGAFPAAADALDHALKLSPEDPGLWQERAEVAMLEGRYAEAETFARKAIGLGSRTGPLCRRHWAMIEQSQLARGETVNAASAHAQIAGCTVPGIKRY